MWHLTPIQQQCKKYGEKPWDHSPNHFNFSNWVHDKRSGEFLELEIHSRATFYTFEMEDQGKSAVSQSLGCMRGPVSFWIPFYLMIYHSKKTVIGQVRARSYKRIGSFTPLFNCFSFFFLLVLASLKAFGDFPRTYHGSQRIPHYLLLHLLTFMSSHSMQHQCESCS